MQEHGDQIWLKPNADVGDISSIWGYALTVDGYRYAKPTWESNVVTSQTENKRSSRKGESGRVLLKN